MATPSASMPMPVPMPKKIVLPMKPLTLVLPKLTNAQSMTIPLLINASQPATSAGQKPRLILLKILKSTTPEQETGVTASAESSRILTPKMTCARLPFLPGQPTAMPTTKTAQMNAHPRQNGPLPAASMAALINTNADTDRHVKTVDQYANKLAANRTAAHHMANAKDEDKTVTTTFMNTNTDWTELAQTDIGHCQKMMDTSRCDASMATGLQLSDADALCDHPPAMSGAMQASAVEKINVPVFIDEYLQKIELENTLRSNSNSDDNSNNGVLHEIGSTSKHEDFLEDNFEFDMNMIAETYNNNNNNNNNNNSSSISTSTNYDYLYKNDITEIQPSIWDNVGLDLKSPSAHLNHKPEGKEGDDCFQSLPSSLPLFGFDSVNDILMSPPSLQSGEECETSPININDVTFDLDDCIDLGDEAVNLMPISNECISLVDCLNGSQQRQQQPPFAAHNYDDNIISISQHNSQTIVTNAEPVVPEVPADYGELFHNDSQTSIKNECPSDLWPTLDKFLIDEVQQPELALEELEPAAKRRKVAYKTPYENCTYFLPGTVDTQEVVEFANYINNSEAFDAQYSNAFEQDPFGQYVINSINTTAVTPSPTPTPSPAPSMLVGQQQQQYQPDDASSTAISLLDSGSIYSPRTPPSCNSSSAPHTANATPSYASDFITAPNTPTPLSSMELRDVNIPSSLSTDTSLATSPARPTTTKRRRGRPAKQHSDLPDEEQLRALDPYERKSLLDRAKNNEASRLSRLKYKQREQEEINEERLLESQNCHLRKELGQLHRMAEKLKRRLKENHFRLSLRV